MKIVQINAVYGYSSIGRTTNEMHEYFNKNNISSYVFISEYKKEEKNVSLIGNKFDHKLHAFFSKLIGKQGYFSYIATKQLINKLKKIKPDVVHLRNLHSNYINLNMLFKYLVEENIATVITLHDCWFFTGKCTYYSHCNCNKWENICHKCPSLHYNNNSYFFDFSKQMQKDKKYYFENIKKLGVVGVSNWIREESERSFILKNTNAKFKTIYNWIDNDIFYPKDSNQLKEKYNYSNKFIILGISQVWSFNKGENLFIELSKMIPDNMIILLVGDTELDVKLNNDKIKYIKPTNDVNILSDYYSMADVFVNPSIQETFGKTTAEAMTCGTPVLGYNSTATPELIGNDGMCGYIMNTRDAKDYLEKILLIQKNGKDNYKNNCRNKALNLFDKNTNIEKYIEFYKELLKNN